MRNENVKRPQDIRLPFFAYGLFRPGQLAFFQLCSLVSKAITSASSGQSLAAGRSSDHKL